MLDHAFTDTISVLRDSLESVLLERLTLEERFQVDILLGDCSWQTSYGLPGEAVPARVRADVTLNWPTWSQTAYRNWTIGEPGEEPPVVDVSIVFRMQLLDAMPDLEGIAGAISDAGPDLGAEPLRRAAPTVEINYDDELASPQYALEITYEGPFAFDERALDDGSTLDRHFGQLGSWVSTTLVRLGDLDLWTPDTR